MTIFFKQGCMAAACLAGMAGQAGAEVLRWDISVTELTAFSGTPFPDSPSSLRTVEATGFFTAEDSNGDQQIDKSELLHFEMNASEPPLYVSVSASMTLYDKADTPTGPLAGPLYAFLFDIPSNTLSSYSFNDGYWHMNFGNDAGFSSHVESVQYYWNTNSVTTITAVPEPGTLAMGALGLAGILVARRRRLRS